MEQEGVVEEGDEEDGDDVDDPGAGLDELQPVETDDGRRGHSEEALAPQPPGDEVDHPDQQAARDGDTQPPRPAVAETESGDRRRHQELGQGRLGVEVVDRRLVKILGGVDREVHLVEDEAALPDRLSVWPHRHVVDAAPVVGRCPGCLQAGCPGRPDRSG